VFFLTTQPVVLGYSGLVTHDAAAAAGVGLSIVAFLRWLERPTAFRALLFGAAYGFSILCKFSCLLYVPIACGAILLVRITLDRKAPAEARRLLATTALIPVTTIITIWAGYGFAFGRPTDVFGIQAMERLHIHGAVPAPQFVDGVARLANINREGMTSYFFGEARSKGWWLYFPAALALKTTLGFLLLLLLALLAARSRLLFESLAAAAGILVIAMTSTLDLGVRYVLPLFVPLSVAGGAAVTALFEKRGAALRVIAVVLIAWHLGASIVAHPDYFPYFNELAGGEPSRYLIDSNLDWGQDAFRLAKTARHLKIPRLGVAYFGNADLDAVHLPPHYRLTPDRPATGWIAVSEHLYRMDGTSGGWSWLNGRPYQMVGKSIRLYYIGN
jgi:hypothetical protein